MNITLGAVLGYSSVNSILSLKMPPSQIVFSGPKITAFQRKTLSGLGQALMPSGGSFCSTTGWEWGPEELE